jgi:hypothetical protein
MGAPDQPRDKDGKWTSGGSVGDHQASQTKPVAPGRQPRHNLPRGSDAAAQRKAAHDAGRFARMDAYAGAHGGQQAPNASGDATKWQGPPTPRGPVIMAHMGKKSVGTHPASSGVGGGGVGGASSEKFVGALKHKGKIVMSGGTPGLAPGGAGTPKETRGLSSAARDRIIRQKAIDQRHYGQTRR